MEGETSCSKTHYYQAGDVFKASVNGKVYNGYCPLTFIQESGWSSGSYQEPCVSLCVKILIYSLDSCQVRMAYQDGLNDYDPVVSKSLELLNLCALDYFKESSYWMS